MVPFHLRGAWSFKTSLIFFAVLVLFAFECKQLYMKMKKERRYVYYNEYAREVGGGADKVEEVDNKSYVYILRLNKLLGTAMKRKLENSTEGGAT